MARRGRRLTSPGNALTLLGVGHAAWALIAYRKPLREIVRAGVVGAVGDGIFDRTHDRGARAAGFWFLLAAPLIAVDGRLTEAALRAGDRRAIRVSGGTTLGLGLLGTAVIPRSGFPVAVPLGVWLLRRAATLDRTGAGSAVRAADTTRRAGDDH
jgi:hypothetical protein